MKKFSAVYAILAAVLFGINAPFSKLLLNEIQPLFLAALLYLGAGIGISIIYVFHRRSSFEPVEARLTRKELPYVILMILLDIAAPFLLLFGIQMTNSSTASLLSVFEITATAIVAMLFFQEAIGRRLWIAIACISLASMMLTLINPGSLEFTVGAVLVLLACVCWGFENNCTRMLSIKDPLQIVILKGFGSGLGALIIALIWEGPSGSWLAIILGLILGFVAYGLSIYFYIKAQRELGAARTSAYYAAAPFVGVLISWIIFQEPISTVFITALAVMVLGSYLAITENHGHLHIHQPETHEHKHAHDDEHHFHDDEICPAGEHCHLHTHEQVEHHHRHFPDFHHRHQH